MGSRFRIRLVHAAILVCMASLLPRMCIAANLLANPGFEDGYQLMMGSAGHEAVTHGWTALFPGSFSYSVEETHYCGNPGNGDCHPRTGGNAVSVSTEGNGEAIAYQELGVVPGGAYTASVWAKGYDYSGDGTGFGAAATDSAGLWVQELDSAGNIVVDHPEQKITQPLDYTLLSVPFTATANTTRVLFMLRGVIACHWTKGRLSFDDAALDGPAPANLLTGVVKGDGSVLEGATVTVTDSSGAVTETATSAANGEYTISDVSLGSVTIRASKTAYFAQRVTKNLVIGTTHLDFDLTGVGQNLLQAPGFDDLYNPEGVWKNAIPGAGPESAVAAYGPVHYHSGFQATAFGTGGGNVANQQYQVASVLPSTEYTARVRFYGVGASWGGNPGQVATLYVQECDRGGCVLLEHPVVQAAGGTGDWEVLEMTFTTGDQTSLVRVGAYAYLVDSFYASLARAVFDSFELNGPAGPPMPTLYGFASSGGVPLQDARAEVVGSPDSTTTDSAGYWGLTAPSGWRWVRISKDGYYAQRKRVNAPDSVQFDLCAVDANILSNAGFDDGWPADGWYTNAAGLAVVGHEYGLADGTFDTGEEAANVYLK